MIPDTSDLSAYHLLVVRPETQGRQWAEQLQQAGATVTLQPMMSIVPLTDEVSERAIINHILAFADYKKAIFISQNAVTYGLQWLDKYWPQLPIDTAFFAIGKATAALLEKHMQAGILYDSPEHAMNSEELLKHPQLQQVEGEKILIFRGKGGRQTLAEQLAARGAIVEYCELYERQVPQTQAPQALVVLDKDFRQTQKHAVLAVHSGETLANVCQMMHADEVLWLKQQCLLLPGERVADIAREVGFQQIIVAENATHDSMIAALLAYQHKTKTM